MTVILEYVEILQWYRGTMQKFPIVSSLLYHNLQIIHTDKIKSLSLLQMIKGFLRKFMEIQYHIQSWSY